MTKGRITEEEVKKIAEISILKISKKETNVFSEVLSQTLEYIDVLTELNTEGISTTFQVTGLKNVGQSISDGTQTLTTEGALSNADKSKEGLFVTKGVFDR